MLPTDTYRNSPYSTEEDLAERRRLTMELRQRQLDNLKSYVPNRKFPSSINEAGRNFGTNVANFGRGALNMADDFYRGVIGMDPRTASPSTTSPVLNLGLSPDVSTLADRMSPTEDPTGTGTVLLPNAPGTGTVLRSNQSPALQQDPALASDNMALAPIPALVSNVSMPLDQFESASTDRKRDRTTFGEFLANRPGMSERLIRMGSAMQGASPRGLTAAMAAMGQEYSNVNAEQRAQEALMAQAQQKQIEEEKSKAEDLEEKLIPIDKLALRLSTALEEFGAFDNVTGITIKDLIARVGDYAGLGNADREAFRFQLRKIIVEETLLNTENTKGAISNYEMKLFKSGVPKMNDTEEVWISWLQDRLVMLDITRDRIANGYKASPDDNWGGKFGDKKAPEAGGSGSKYRAMDIVTN